jgi:chromosomal replication initiator protein
MVGGVVLDSLWDRVLLRLNDHIPDEEIEEWLRPTKVFQDTEKELKVIVPNDLFIDWIEENYLETIHDVLSQLDCAHKKITFLEEKEAKQVQLSKLNEPSLKTEDTDISSSPSRGRVRLNPKYRFENFVVGSSNQFAHAAALAVAETPSTSYNPLFLYGSSGLGKTHLLHAIGHALIDRRSDLNICYTTCEEFTNQFINAIRYNKSDAFRERYRGVDVLLIDDIQFLSGKQQTQEEFFHTFNTLFEQQKQIILSSDCAPAEIDKLEARLTSRFQWGLIADVQAPALETRIAILRKKAEAEKVRLPDNVVLYIANKIKTNVRELEGALVKLMAYAKLSNRIITLDLAEQALKNLVREESPEISCERIQKTVSEYYKLNPKEIISKSNAKRIAQPRQVAMYLTRHMTDMSLPEIGVAFGNKHHSTVLYSIQKIEDQIKSNHEYRNLIASFKKSLS